MRRLALIAAALGFGLSGALAAPEKEKPVERDYVTAPSAPFGQSQAEADAKSAGCYSCHTETDQPTMHASPSVILGCTDCHGGDATVMADGTLPADHPDYVAARDSAHILPRYPESWGFPGTANPKRSYTLLNREAPEFIRFVNPSDYRIVRESCGACHLEIIEAAERSLMATGAMLWGGAAYNNGILPFKNYILGEAYTRDGKPAALLGPGTPPGTVSDRAAARGVLPWLAPLPTWHVIPPADVFRVFERGGRNVITQFAEIGLPNALGQIQRLEEPGRPDLRQSNRGPGTGLRVAIPVLNIHKTRLNDPFMWFMGTNDQPGDYRTSGCAACHTPYANDREPRHSLTYVKYGRDGETATVDPTIPKGESGHPIRHMFTTAIPTAQCMNCHMHQPNMFLNTYLGYTMWDYESDAPAMWPAEQHYPTIAEQREVLDRNPEGAATKGLWRDVDFLRNVYDLNPALKDTQFADYHGHGWNFRGVFKRDRDGNLLDAEGNIVDPEDPEKWRKDGEDTWVPVGTNPGKTVHLMSIHAEVGMQCADCHFSGDSHGNGYIHGEVANAVEIRCRDCHGTADAYPTLRTSNVAATPRGRDLASLRNGDGRRRFEWMERNGRQVLIQRSIVDPALEWEMTLVKDTVDAGHPDYNPKAARAKLLKAEASYDGSPMQWGPGVAREERAHDDEEMACFTCHLSWTTSCGGCHLPIEANWKTKTHKYDEETTRNYATYNPQVARDQMFQLGKHQTTKDNIVAPVRSSSALVLTSTNVNRERIYVQQPPVSAIGFSSQAFAPHFPHTVRKTETKTCTDCHVSAEEDNNAIMAQLLLLGTNFVNFVGLHAYVGLEDGFEAIRVTEFEEPQAVFGSYLQEYAYPDYYAAHVERNGRELINWTRGEIFDTENGFSGETGALEEIANVHQDAAGDVRCLQHRGEYLFVAEGRGGFRVYDIASVANKGFSERIVTAPFSPLGHDPHVKSANATCMALATNQPINPLKNTPEMQEMNQEQPMHPIYRYAVVTDAEEGLILVDVTTFADGEPRNNFIDRALTWNEGGALDGARHITLAGHLAYIAADAGIVVVDLDDPLAPRLVRTVPLPGVRATAVQFRYLFATSDAGFHTLDLTDLRRPEPIPTALVPMADGQRIYVARTYAYVAGGREGLYIIDVERPREPRLFRQVTDLGDGLSLRDTRDVIVATTNASLFAYVADGEAGFKLLQLTSPMAGRGPDGLSDRPSMQPNFYGFSPEPRPELIAWRDTRRPALSISKGLDRDRAVDETGHQMAVFGRLGSRPFTRPEMEGFFLGDDAQVFRVTDEVEAAGYVE
jgi:hypothetical protein